MKKITEESATILIPKEDKISKKLSTFYNPVMKLNRDMTILALQNAKKQSIEIVDPLAASGIRAIRMLKELKENLIESITVNDLKEDFKDTFQKNMELSNIQTHKLNITSQDANKLLLENYFDYIDIDPFGSPNKFLAEAVKSIRRKGILAITATDTAPLCGTYPKACQRKYWAKPLRNHMMHEFGLRILIRKVQLIGAQYDKALTPILSYAKDHYMRIFFENQKGKTKVDNILQKHDAFEGAGPIWIGNLHNRALLKAIKENNIFPKRQRFIDILYEESTQPELVGFFDLHKLMKQKVGNPPKTQVIIDLLKSKGYKATQTHFAGTGIRTDCSKEELMHIITKAITSEE